MCDDDDFLPEDNIALVECVCEHEEELHSWSHCKVEGCKCEGHWEE